MAGGSQLPALRLISGCALTMSEAGKLLMGWQPRGGARPTVTNLTLGWKKLENELTWRALFGICFYLSPAFAVIAGRIWALMRHKLTRQA